MLENDGVATIDLVNGVVAKDDRRKKGAYAVIECFQSIPCNPCSSSCPKQAIIIEDICDLPSLDFEKCNGCAICAAACPGLAIFIIDETYSETEAIIKLPYELVPLPQKNEVVSGINREGRVVCDAIVHSIVNGKNQNLTPIVWLRVPKEFAQEVRFFKQKSESEINNCCNGSNKTCVPLDKMECAKNDAYVCRCEEITVSQIRAIIDDGFTTLDEIKRVSRAGMGACQGRTCRQLIMNEIASKTGVKHEEQQITTFRPTSAPIKMGLLCGEDNENE